MRAFASACSICLRAAAVACCPDYQHYATAALAQNNRLAEAAANPPGVLDGLGAEEDFHRFPGLYLSGGSGQAARGAVPALQLSRGAE
jgi:hypothetical protein